MKKKPTSVSSASVRISTHGELTKVEVTDGYFSKEDSWVFFLPKATRDSLGFVPGNIIRSRMLRDFNVTLGYYSTSLCL